MEIPVFNGISEFEVSMENPSLLSRVLSDSGLEASSLWTWGALILALLASVGTIVNGIKVFIVKSRSDDSLASEPLQNLVSDEDIEDEEQTSPLSSSSFEVEKEEDYEEPESNRWRATDEDFRVAGGSGLYEEIDGQNHKSKHRRQFSWTDLACGRSVVKVWDNVGLGLDFEDDGSEFDDYSRRVVSIYDRSREQKIGSFCCGQKAATVSPSPPVILTATRENGPGGISLRVWDSRIRRRIPAMLGEWRPQVGKIVGVGYGGVEKVYVWDDASGNLTVGDVRNVTSPLKNVTVPDVEVDTWWDADSVIVKDEFHEE